MDWRNKEIRHAVEAEMVSPSGYTHLGWLPVSGGTLTAKYYSDDRIQASIDTYRFDEYIDLAMIRLIHTARLLSETYREELGTFFVDISEDKIASKIHSASLDLNSVLWGMSEDQAVNETNLANGGYAKDAFQQILNLCMRPFKMDDNFNNYRFGSNLVLEAFDSYLSHLYQIADISGNRVDCDTMGNVTISKYVPPANRTPRMSLAYGDPLIVLEPVRYSNGDSDTYSRAIVTWDHSINSGSDYSTKTITGYADSDNSRLKIANRGYRRSAVYREDDLGDSLVLAQNKAKTYLETDSVGTVTWELKTKWFPIDCGDVIKWTSKDGTSRNCMVTALDKQLGGPFTIDIIMKEV